MNQLSTISKILLAFALVGAINWGLVGFFNWNLVDAIFGGGSQEETSGLSRFLYALIGLAGAWLLFALPRFREVPGRVTGRAEVRP